MSKSKQNQPRPEPNRDSGDRRSSAASASRREQLRAQQAAEAQRARTRRIVTVVAIALAAIIVAVVVVVLVQNNQRQQDQQQQQGTAEQFTPPNVTDDGVALKYAPGTADGTAPDVRVFLDYQCPGCGDASELVDPLLESLAQKGEIQLSYQMLYGLDRALGTDHSFRAAIAGTCSDAQGVFPEYSKLVFANQPVREGDGWTDEQLRDEFPAQVGLSGDKLAAFQSCYDGRATSDFVNKMQDTKPDIVNATPFFLVNGEKPVQFTGADLASEQALLSAIERAAA